MKITRSQLKQIIKEELEKVLSEDSGANLEYVKGVIKYRVDPSKILPIPEKLKSFAANKDKRDGAGNYHITIVDPRDIKVIRKQKGLSSRKVGTFLEDEVEKANISKDGMVLGKISFAQRPGGEEGDGAYYIPVAWPAAQDFRRELGLQSEKDLHITIGFGPGGDVHGVEKK